MAHAPEHAHPGPRLAWAALAAAAVLALGLAADAGQPLGAVVAVVAVVAALVALRPLTPAGTLRARRGLASVVASRGLLAGAFFAAEVYLPYLLARRYGVPPALSGVTLTAAAVTWAGGAWVQGRLGERLASRDAVRFGTILVAVAVGASAAVAALHAPVWLAVVSWAVAGAGMGLTYSRQTVLMISYSPQGAEGANSAGLSIADSVGASLALSATGLVFLAAGGEGVDASFAAALTLTAVLAIGAAAIAPRVGRPRSSPARVSAG